VLRKLRASITDKWICTRRDCKRNGQRYYWITRDEKPFHMPVGGTVLTACAETMRKDNGSASLLQPPRSAIAQMSIDKRVLEQSEERQRLAANGGGGMLWFYPPPPAYMPPQQAIAAPSSSPLQLPSTQSSDLEVRASFFQ
jgi:hypothetical protein